MWGVWGRSNLPQKSPTVLSEPEFGTPPVKNSWICPCFVLFVNDLPSNVHTQIDMFADDTTLLASSDYINVEELKNTLSREVSNVDEWATNNKLQLNYSETKTVLIDGPRLRKRLSNEDRKLFIARWSSREAR